MSRIKCIYTCTYSKLTFVISKMHHYHAQFFINVLLHSDCSNRNSSLFFIQKYFWKFHHLPIPGSIQQYLHTTGDENKKILLQKLTENYQKNYFPKKGQVQHVCKSRYFKKVLWKWSLLSNLQFQTSQFVTIVRSRKSKYKPSYNSSKATCSSFQHEVENNLNLNAKLSSPDACKIISVRITDLSFHFGAKDI